MSREFYVDDDAFSTTFDTLMGDIYKAAGEALFNGTREGCIYGRDEVRENASGYGWGEHTGYPKMWTYRTTRPSSGTVEGHIYCRKPGLVHLLEKGHATLGGRRTRAFPHVKPAADDTFEKVPQFVLEYLKEGLT
ncbi:MAG: hypothetical protein U0K60_08340 [Parafannyhessea umbonata]|nr:hypothetical protein [Parafannyhessea umbonata]